MAAAALPLANTFPSPDNTTGGRNREVSFSSYLNKSEEAFIRRLAAESSHAKKTHEEDEIGVFSAEKYFNGGIDNQHMIMVATRVSQQGKKEEEEEASTMVVAESKSTNLRSISGTPSLKSESSSWNSQSILLTKSSSNWILRRRNYNPDRRKGLFSGLASCRCYCSGKDSVDVVKEERIGEVSFRGNAGEAKKKKNPIPDCNNEKFQDPENFRRQQQKEEKTCFSFPASTTKLKTQPWWASVRAPKPDDDGGSDASSDLFEIESLTNTTTTSGKASSNTPPFLARQTSRDDVASGCATPVYAPSEASVEWSVATASACAADYLSVASDQLEEHRTQSARRTRGSGGGKRLSLMGCKSGEAVRVASDAAYAIKRERAKAEEEEVVGKSSSGGFRASEYSVPRYRRNQNQNQNQYRHHRPVLNLPLLPARSFSPANPRPVKVNDLEFLR